MAEVAEMSDFNIGIRVADGTFYPVLPERSEKKRKVVLTTVKDNQDSVKIDLFRGQGNDMENPEYIGTLVIDHIEPAGSKEPNIELVMQLDPEGNLEATASDDVTGERQSFSVSLQKEGPVEDFSMPDFEIDNDFDTDEDDYTQIEGAHPSPTANQIIQEYQELKQQSFRPPLAVFILLIALGLVIVTGGAFLIYQFFRGNPVPPLATDKQDKTEALVSETPVKNENIMIDKAKNTEEQAVSEKTIKEEKISPKESISKNQESSSEQSGKVLDLSGIRIGGVFYRLRWGDTLWGLAYSFYNNPWLFNEILKANEGILDPDKIKAGDQIVIPEKSPADKK